MGKFRNLLVILIMIMLLPSCATAEASFANAAAVGSISEGLINYRNPDGLWGFADLEGQTVIEPEWNYAYGFKGGIARVFTGLTKDNGMPQEGLYGYVKRDGARIRPQWLDACDFSEGLAAVRQGGKWGFIDESGALVIPCQWDYVGSFSNGRALVFNGSLKSMNYPDEGSYGFIDAQGKLICDGWEYAGDYADGCARVMLDGKYGYIDLDGAYVSQPQWDFASDFSSGFGMVFTGRLNKYGSPQEGLYGYVSADGRVIEPRWAEAVPFHEGLAPVRENYRWGYIDGSGETVIACKWDYAYYFSSGIGVTFNGNLSDSRRPEDGVFYMLDREGNITGMIPGSEKPDFLNGLASMKSDGGWGAIDSTGSIVIKHQWDNKLYFDENGYALASREGQWHILDKSGMNQRSEDTNSDTFISDGLAD